MVTPRCLASCTNRWAHPRTCTTDPGADDRSGSATVWMLSMMTSSGLSSSMADTMLGSEVSGNSHRLGRTASRRPARKRTCWALSSADTYSVRPGQPANSCSSNVLFPMPGSPPSKVTEPGTKPPPSTRSSSLIPLGRGPDRSVLISPIGRATPAGNNDMPAAKVLMSSGASISSTKLFHAEHAGQRPAHLG